MDDEHVLALVEAIHGADLDAIHVLTLDAILDDDEGHDLFLLVLFAVANAFAGGAQASSFALAAPVPLSVFLRAAPFSEVLIQPPGFLIRPAPLRKADDAQHTHVLLKRER
jgi:hypothetical protein